MTLEEDFLENDTPIPGQNFVCLSFVSPDNQIEKKEQLYMTEFLKRTCENFGLDKEKALEFSERYSDFKYANQDTINKMFNEQNEGVCSVRGLKVRGVYDTLKEAQVRAKVLQRRDQSFHVFVGQVGFWLPWDPEPSQVSNEEYLESQLNDLVKNYKENQKDKEEYFATETRQRSEKAKQEGLENSSQNTVELNTNDSANNDDGEEKELVFDSRNMHKTDPVNTTDNVDDLNTKSEENLQQVKDELFDKGEPTRE